MKEVNVLDCTLRDGGYCNQWQFGNRNIHKIISSLNEANVEIIECGFLTEKVTYDTEVSKFTTVEELATVIPADKNGRLYVAMVNYGEYEVDRLPVNDGKSVDGLRVAFHKKHYVEAMAMCEKIQQKGYLVFVQPMLSMAYTDEDFLKLIRIVNGFKPYAFYIVDSFGMMKRNDLIRLYYLVEHNLNEEIWVGFHSHNNMQLAYSNAQSLVDQKSNRKLIIDCSIYGMGRGAGNLNTELFVQYLNENYDGKYNLKSLLSVIDQVLSDFYCKNYWGYSLPNYLSAAHNVHPNYASFFADKNTLTAEAMEELFTMMDGEKKVTYDKKYAEEIYLQYMATGQTQDEHRDELLAKVVGKEVLLIAPGRSAADEKEKISSFVAAEDVLVVSVNFDYTGTDVDHIFLSNLRRFRELSVEKRSKCIVTSNIPADNVYLQTRYHDLLMPIESVRDNAGMMAIKFFSDLRAKKIVLAGFDGYSHEADENYASKQMVLVTKNAVVDAMNKGMADMISVYSKKTNICFLTSSRFER